MSPDSVLHGPKIGFYTEGLRSFIVQELSVSRQIEKDIGQPKDLQLWAVEVLADEDH